ncbi:uncharacterized protein LOC144468743 [Augochlora pura]
MVTLASLLLLSGILLVGTEAAPAPASYDQRQTGEVNVDAKLDNFVILVSNSLNKSWLDKLANEGLAQLTSLSSRRNVVKQDPEKLSDVTVYETEEKGEGREPYHVEIVRIQKDDVAAVGSKQPETLNSEISEAEVTGKLKESTKPSKNSPEISINGKASENGSRNQKSRKLIDGSRSKKVHVGLTVDDLTQADDLTTKEEVAKAARPGMSLKKQLSKKEEEELSALSEERNELNNKRDELVLLGDGVENCGPGRYRDKSGTCQEDKDFY